jgi:hypothetical protein
MAQPYPVRVLESEWVSVRVSELSAVCSPDSHPALVQEPLLGWLVVHQELRLA